MCLLFWPLVPLCRIHKTNAAMITTATIPPTMRSVASSELLDESVVVGLIVEAAHLAGGGVVLGFTGVFINIEHCFKTGSRTSPYRSCPFCMTQSVDEALRIEAISVLQYWL